MSAEENKAVVRRYFDEFHSGRRLAIGPEIFADAEGALEAARMMSTAFPDYQITINAQVAEGDMVATVWEARGTHQGEWQSPIGPIAATGKAVTWTGTTTLRLANGKIADIVGTNWDHLGILQQMGALPATAPRSGA
jgi:predicted ester cyclase